MRARLRGRPLAAVVPIGIGHNNGPPMASRWGLHCWQRAQARAWASPGPEVVRLRMRRAAELGLTYRQFASILMESGQSPTALVFTLDALAAPGAGERLRRLERPRVLVVAVDRDGRAEARIRQAREAAGGRIDGWCAVDDPAAPALLELLAAQTISPKAAVLVGAHEADRALASRARLAAFLPAEAYFGGSSAPQPTTGPAR